MIKKLLTSRWLYSFLGLMAICLIVWFVLPIISIADSAVFEAELTRLLIIGTLLFLWFIYFAYRLFKMDKLSDQKREVEEISEQAEQQLPKARRQWRHRLGKWLKYLLQTLLVGTAVGLSAWGSLYLWSQFATGDPATLALNPCQSRPGLAPEMILIPGGTFMMGSPDTELEPVLNERLHEVTVKSFSIGRCEVTFAEYDAFADATGRDKPDDQGWGRNRRPVIYVSWNDAAAYAQWLSEQSNQSYSLPTEAEWEYATRADSTTAFWWGNTITTEQANYNGNFTYNNGVKGENRKQTLEVGQFEPNPFGLYDVHGNVWEWSCSNYDSEYAGAELQCVEPGAAGRRVLRGGSWFNGPGWLRSAYRFYSDAAYRNYVIGFRLARAIP